MALKPPVEVPQGAIRLNTDSQKLEFFAQDQWWEMATEVAAPTGGRGIINVGGAGSNSIEYLEIATKGNTIDFGNRTGNYEPSQNATASRTRAIFAGGEGNTDTIDYVTIAQAGDAVDFGNLVSDRGAGPGAVGNQVRGVFAGGRNPGSVNTIEYITIASTGNSTDFGDMTAATQWPGGLSSPTRGLFMGGNGAPGAPAYVKRIDYITLMSTGNANDFGDLIEIAQAVSGVSNSVRGLMAGGQTPSGATDLATINMVQIATLGDGQDFGDLTLKRRACGGVGSPIRGIWVAGHGPSAQNIIDYVDIATTGNAADFGGDATGGFAAGTSNCHGGLI